MNYSGSGIFDQDYETESNCAGYLLLADGNTEIECEYEGEAIGTLRGSEFTWECPACGSLNEEYVGA